MRIVVTGGRYYADKETLWAALDEIWENNSITLLGHGACHYGGADILAEDWAKDRQVPYMGIPAEWNKYSKSAGMLRNRKMLDLIKPDIVLAFAGGTGTKGCIKEAKQRGIEVIKYD